MRRALTLIAIAIAMSMFVPASVLAYDNDTHFWFTYYLAVEAGYTKLQAMQIASADVSVDYDEDTQPVLPNLESLAGLRHPLDHFQYVRSRLHALPLKSEIIRRAGLPNGYWWDPLIIKDPKVLTVARQLVEERKAEFWMDTVREGRNPGIFLHYLEDTFAHDGFASYIGHAGYYRVDYMASDVTKADRMTFSVLKYLIAFREVTLNGKAADKFSDPESVNLVLYLNNVKMADIRTAIQRFCEANPSAGSEPNDLVKEWRKLDDKERRERNNVPPPSFFMPFYKANSEGPSPDSARAREAVLRLLNLRRDDLPLIWAYNLKDSGFTESDYTDEAYVYKERDLTLRPAKFNSDDEKANKERRRIRDKAGNPLCLPFKLLDVGVKDVPVCVGR